MAEKKVDNFSRVDADLLERIARDIPHAFILMESKEGASFWYRIQRRLREIAKSSAEGKTGG